MEMSMFKSRMAWVAALAVILMPLLAACGAETPTATPIAAATDTPAAAPATDTPSSAASAATNTPLLAIETPTGATGAMTGTTPTAGGTSMEDKLASLASEGIKPDPNAKGKLEFFSWWTAGGEAEGKN